MSGVLTATTPTGESLQIHYEGDVVVEFSQPYKVKTAKPDLTGVPADFPKDVLAVNSVEDVVLRLRLSLLLAIRREGSRPQIVPTWRRIDDPLNAGDMTSWNDAHQATNLMPIQLTSDEMRTWQDCYVKLTTPILKNIHVAASRIVRATGERRDSSDVLIDSVIAWENLFGSGEGETTMRVSTCLALLFEQDFESRKSKQKRLQDIYRMRSRVVHGSGAIGADDVAMCFEALDVAVDTLRKLIDSKSGLLEIANSSERSKYLLLHGDSAPDRRSR